MNKHLIEETLKFTPKFDDNGLIPCITTCAKSGDVLMFAFMNQEALLKTIQSGEVHYWSRSRQSLWRKGATSGLTQHVTELRTDCDQDCIWVKVEIGQNNQENKIEASCHTGRKSCFYRQVQISPDAKLSDEMNFIDDEKLYDPKDLYT